MSLGRLLRTGLAVSGAACAACTPFVEDPPVDAAEVEASPPCDPATPFGTPTPVSGLDAIMATSVADLRLSPDGMTAYFSASGRPDGVGPYFDLYVATRDSPTSPFGAVTPIAGSGIDTPADELYPTVTADGLTLVFGRMIPSTNPLQLYQASRASPSIPFTDVTPVAEGADLGATAVTTPFLRADGEVLYSAFVSSLQATMSTDIYRAARSGSTLATPVAVAEINTTSSEIAPVVTADDLTIYFASDRGDGSAQGDYDVWVATRARSTDPFSAPINLTAVNTAQYEVPTFATSDGCALYLSSTRGGSLSVYVATRRSP